MRNNNNAATTEGGRCALSSMSSSSWWPRNKHQQLPLFLWLVCSMAIVVLLQGYYFLPSTSMKNHNTTTKQTTTRAGTAAAIKVNNSSGSTSTRDATTTTITTSQNQDGSTITTATTKRAAVGSLVFVENQEDDRRRSGGGGNDSSDIDFFSQSQKNGEKFTSSSPLPPSSTSRLQWERVPSTPWHRDTILPLCQREQIIEGKWVQRILSKPPYVTPTVHLRCYPKEAYYPSSSGGATTITASSKEKRGGVTTRNDGVWNHTWSWEPRAMVRGDCTFGEWDAALFCRLLQGGTVAVVGDSLSWEQYSSLVQMLGVKTRQNFQHQSRELGQNIIQPVCSGRARIMYRRDDFLNKLSDALNETSFPVVLVLNRGAHYVPDEELVEGIRGYVLPAVREWLATCRSMGLQCHLFWRTSVPGHPNCDRYDRPVNDLSQMEALVEDKSAYDNRTINYHWYDYQHQNELVRKLLEEELSDNIPYQVIDAYYVNMLRPDEHRAHQGDCLHSCYPGKMDVYNRLLLHYLRMTRTLTDVQRLRGAKLKLPKATAYDSNATDAARLARIRDKQEKREQRKATSSKMMY